MEILAVPGEILLLEHGLLQQKGLARALSQQQVGLLGQPHLLGPCFWAGTEALEALGHHPEVAALIPLLEALAGVAGVD
jgi:hypothetical protein